MSEGKARMYLSWNSPFIFIKAIEERQDQGQRLRRRRRDKSV